ncbi:MAG: SGNH/GDSL hydrolase family protein [Bacteroidales bacterium]
MKVKYLILINFFWIINLSCQENAPVAVFVPFNSTDISYQGRVSMKDSLAELYWSGTQVKINFKGTGIKATFKDSKGDNYYNIIIDNDSISILRIDTIKKEYVLASGLVDKPHNIKIYKRTEWNRGTTSFYGFVPDKGAVILNSPVKNTRKIEFFGNSITAGYGVEDYSGKDRSDSIFTNNYLTYAAITARHFNAECNYTVRSGIGIMVSWFPLIMPEMYDLLNPNDSLSKWDFSKFTPDVVVINLFQNDSWIVNMPKSKEYQYRFKNKPKPDEKKIISSYAGFVKSIREKYNNAHIICMLGNMDITKKGSPWPGYVEKAVASLNDPMVYTLFVPFKNTPGHPKVKEQMVMADSLIKFIEQNIKW